jgi:hypothetical protein
MPAILCGGWSGYWLQRQILVRQCAVAIGRVAQDLDLRRRLSRLQRSRPYRRSRGHPLWSARHDLWLRDSGDDPGRDDRGYSLAPQGLAPAAALIGHLLSAPGSHPSSFAAKKADFT